MYVMHRLIDCTQGELQTLDAKNADTPTHGPSVVAASH